MAGDDSIIELPVHNHQLTQLPTKRLRRPPLKFRSIEDCTITATNYKSSKVMNYSDDVSHITCGKCGSGNHENQLLLCDKCDGAYHMVCLRPIVARIPIGDWYCPNCALCPTPLKSSGFPKKSLFEFFRIPKFSFKRISPQDSSRRRRRSNVLVHHKRNRRLLPYVPSEDLKCRLKQMRSLALALTSLSLAYGDDLTYPPGMAKKSANKATLEKGGMQVLSKEDTKTLEMCRAMAKRGEHPPLLVVYDSHEGFTVQADGPIKDLTLIAEYVGNVDYIVNREQDDGDSMMTLLLAINPKKSLVICPDSHTNIARFINGINNHNAESRKKKNLKCVRYNVNGECRVLLVATRDIAKGEKLYFDYNGYEHAYPTDYFI